MIWQSDHTKILQLHAIITRLFPDIRCKQWFSPTLTIRNIREPFLKTRARTSKTTYDNTVRFRQENNPIDSIFYYSTNKFIQMNRTPCWGLRHRALPLTQCHGLKTVKSLQKHSKTLSLCIDFSLSLEDATRIDLNLRSTEQIWIDFSPGLEDATWIDLNQRWSERILSDFSPSLEDVTWIDLNRRSREYICIDSFPILKDPTRVDLNQRSRE